jgi:drug/metabolite transporter (DMT)-like permease
VHADPAYRRGLVLVLLAGVCWSSIGIGVRLMESATAWQILFYRSIALAVFLFLALAIQSRGRPGRLFRQAGLSAVLGGLALVLAFGGSIFSIANTTVANAMFLFASAPFFVAVLGRMILGESVRRATWIAMAVAGAGVAFMVFDGLSLGQLWGNLAAVVSAIGFAFFTIALRWGRSENMLPAVCFGGVFAAVVAGGMCLGSGQTLALPFNDLALSLGLGVFQLGTGLTVYTLGSRSVPAAELALLSMTEVMLGPFWVWLFLGETAGFYTLAGGALLLGAIAGNALSGLRRQPPPIGAV